MDTEIVRVGRNRDRALYSYTGGWTMIEPGMTAGDVPLSQLKAAWQAAGDVIRGLDSVARSAEADAVLTPAERRARIQPAAASAQERLAALQSDLDKRLLSVGAERVKLLERAEQLAHDPTKRAMVLEWFLRQDREAQHAAARRAIESGDEQMLATLMSLPDVMQPLMPATVDRIRATAMALIDPPEHRRLAELMDGVAIANQALEGARTFLRTELEQVGVSDVRSRIERPKATAIDQTVFSAG